MQSIIARVASSREDPNEEISLEEEDGEEELGQPTPASVGGSFAVVLHTQRALWRPARAIP